MTAILYCSITHNNYIIIKKIIYFVTTETKYRSIKYITFSILINFPFINMVLFENKQKDRNKDT